MKEIWKDIKGYEGLYQVSNTGKVKILSKNIIKKTTKVPKGYLRVGLTKNGKTKYFYPHRLVAQAFIPNLQNKPCVNHKDRNVKNNNVDNLEWCTYKENNNYENCQKRRITSRSISLVINQIKDNFPEEKEVITKLEEIKKKLKEL